jgi:HlyD family secretion protein
MSAYQLNAGEIAPVAGNEAVRKPGHRNHWLVPIIGLVLLLLGGTAVWWHLRADSPLLYSTQKVTRGSVIRTVSASGTVNPVIVVQVGTYVSGIVQARYCDYNTEVKKGQLCAKIDPRLYEPLVEEDSANLAVAKAQLVKDTANLAYTKLSYERNQTLVSKQSASQDALDNSKNSLDQAQAQVGLDQAGISLREAELKAAQVNLDYTDIRSPVDGTVVSRNVEMGQTVAASFQTPTLFLIATDLTNMQVDTNVSESDVGALKVGAEAPFTVESFANHPFDGKVIQIRQSPQTIQNVVTYDAVVSAPNGDLLLKPGMTATVRLTSNRRDDVLRVPDQALRYFPGGVSANGQLQTDANGSARVYVLRNGKPVAVSVEIGLDDDTNTEIVKGSLEPGDEVIVGGGASAEEAVQTAQPAGPRAPRL